MSILKKIFKSKIVTRFQERLKGLTPRALAAETKTALSWFRRSVMDRLGKKKGTRIIPRLVGHDVEGIKMVKVPEIGRMMFFLYNPKWAKILKYYDKFPLVVPINYYPDGFLGLNLHYLPLILRATLLDTLITLSEQFDEEQYSSVSYEILKGLGGTVYKPTIKRYLYSHVASQFAVVPFDEWEIAAMLPVEDFRKADKREVWADSKAYIRR